MARPTRTSRTAASRTRLSVEPLEDRAVPAVDLAFRDTAYAAGADAAGNVYVHGNVSGTADLDSGPGTWWLAGPTQYVAKYTPAGGLVWARRADNLYGTHSVLAASSAGGLDFVTLMEFDGVGAPVLTRYRDTGTGLAPVWSTRTGAPGRIAVGGDGAVYVSEGFSGTVDFDPADAADPTPLTGDALTSTGQDAFLARWDADGAFRWVRHFGGSGNEWMNDLAVVNDGAGETVCVGGIFDSTFAPAGYAGTPLTNQGVTGAFAQDGYVARYDPAGGLVSVGQFVDAAVRQIAGGAGGIYIAGTHYYDALGLPGTQNEDLYFGKLDSGGEGLTWVKGLAGTGSNRVGELVADGGSLLMAGEFYSPFGPMDFDPDAATSCSLTPAGKSDAFVGSYGAADGAFQWARLMGNAVWTGDSEYASSLVASGSDLYAGGWFAPGQAAFGTDTLTGYAQADGFVTRLSRADGTHQWAFPVGSVVRTIDDRDAGYSEAGGGWKDNTSGGFGYDARYHAKGTGSGVATWAFAGLPAGTYEVMATWKASTKSATSAAYKVNGTTAVRSQRVAPDDYRTTEDHGIFWESLGTGAVGADGKLTVTLSDLANGTVVADAIRIIFKQPAALLVASGPTPDRPDAGVLTAADLKPIVREAVRRWNLTGLTAAERRQLKTVRFDLADLDGLTLGVAAGATVTLDTAAAGHGWFADRTPRSDAEFARAGDQGEQGRMDLLTVVMHELGHVLGRDHEARGVMAEELAAGVRLGPAPAHAAPPASGGWLLASGRRR